MPQILTPRDFSNTEVFQTMVYILIAVIKYREIRTHSQLLCVKEC